jgi:hypothetical protein
MNNMMIKAIDAKFIEQTNEIAQFHKLTTDLTNIFAAKLKTAGVPDEKAMLMAVELCTDFAHDIQYEPQKFFKDLPAGTKVSPAACLDMMMGMSEMWLDSNINATKRHLDYVQKKAENPSFFAPPLGNR